MAEETTSSGANATTNVATTSGDRAEPVSAFQEDASDIGSEDYVVDEKQRQQQLSKRERLTNHCRRFWLWYLIGAIILAAILLPIL